MRRGATLIELLAWIVCALPLVCGAWAVVAEIMRRGPLPDGRIADLACDWLRRDARGGAAVDGATLLAGGHRWSCQDGRLVRDGRELLRLRSFALERDGGIIVLTMQPEARLPLRRLELAP
jgi:hypothetical protein